MRPWQIAVLSMLALFALASVAGAAAVVIATRPAPVAVAQAPEIDVSQDSPTETLVPAAPRETRPAFTASPTPFQPLPLTPTYTPSPTATPTPLPTNTPQPTQTPSPAPEEAVFLTGIWGFPQAFNLSCESRSASDFARYFGVEFTELAFLSGLPLSDNPEAGFVGDVHGYLGQLPPLGYGVHAKPVARLMRSYGLEARAHKGMTLDAVRAEIAAGRPVMIWAIRDLAYSEPVEYTASDGETTIVARFEHTFLVIGYGETYITVLDNERIYSVPTEQFQRSWGVLGNMAITVAQE